MEGGVLKVFRFEFHIYFKKEIPVLKCVNLYQGQIFHKIYLARNLNIENNVSTSNSITLFGVILSNYSKFDIALLKDLYYNFSKVDRFSVILEKI